MRGLQSSHGLLGRGLRGLFRTPLTSTELHPNIALKSATELHIQQAGEVDTLQKDARDLKECIRALERDIKHAESKHANKVDHLEYVRVYNENKFLHSKVARLEAHIATLRAGKPMSIDSNSSGHEKKPDEDSCSLGESCCERHQSPESGLPALLHGRITSAISRERSQAEAEQQHCAAQVAHCQQELDDAKQRAEVLEQQVRAEEAGIEEDESSVKQQRETLHSLHEQLQEQLKERDNAGDKYTEDWKLTFKRLGGRATGMEQDPKACLQAVQDNPVEEHEGLLEAYAALHRQVLELQQKHLQAKEGIAVQEKALQQRCEELQALRNEQTAAEELALMFDKEKRAQEVSAKALGSQVHEIGTREARFHDYATSMCAACGPFAQPHSTETNLVSFALMNAAVEKQLKAHMKVVKALAVNPKDALSRLLSTGDITVREAIEDLGYDEQDVTERVKALFQSESEKAKDCLRGLMECGRSAQFLLSVGFAAPQLLASGVQVKRLLADGVQIHQLLADGCSHEEIAEALCKPLPPPPASSQGSVVTYIFSDPKVQEYRAKGKLDSIVSSELHWDGVSDADFQYSFKLKLYSNGSKESKGCVGLFWQLTYGPHGERRTWPMPHHKVTLRVLCGLHAPDAVEHEACTMGGDSASDVFRSCVAAAVPQGSTLTDHTYVGFHILTVEKANSGNFWLGPDKDAVAVQCELRLV